MDIISFNEASTANGRIESFIENPDSTSGVVTVPTTIAAGETITIPAGRVAILPNVQLDGVLNVENGGEVFIPSGSTLSTVVEKVASTDNAIVRFNGTTGDIQDSGVKLDDNNNIILDYSNVDASSFKQSNANGLWYGRVVPFSSNGTMLFETQYAGNGGGFRFNVDGVQKAIIDASGNVGIGVTPHAWQAGIIALDIGNATIQYGGGTNLEIGVNYYTNSGYKYKNNGYASKTYQAEGAHVWYTAPSGTAGNAIAWTNAMTLDDSGILLQGTSTSVTGAKHQYSDGTIRMLDGYLIAGGAYTGTQTNHLLGFLTNDTERMRISSSGNLLVGTTTDNGLDKLQVNGSISSGSIQKHYSGDLNNFKYITETIGTYPSLYMSNIPIDDHGYLEIIVHSANSYVMQRFTTLGVLQAAGRVFVRCLSNDTWTAWVEK